MKPVRLIALALGLVLSLPALAQDGQAGQSKSRERDKKEHQASQTRGATRSQGSTQEARQGRSGTAKISTRDARKDRETARTTPRPQEKDWRSSVGLGRAERQETERGRTKEQQDRNQDRERNLQIQLGQQKGMGGRSGASNYTTRNNLRSSREDGRFAITRAPQVTSGRLADLVRQEERVRVNHDRRYDDRDYGYGSGYGYGGYRSGYCQYDSNWRDDWFLYAFYLFTPTRNCTISPWYYYPQLPGYINTNRISYYNGRHCDFWAGDPYQYSYSYNRNGYGEPYGYRQDYGGVDRAIDDLVRGFERQDRQAIGRLISRSRDVNVYVDNRYCYTLRSDDFYDLMMDNIFSTRTTRYEIVGVTQAHDGVRVTARHEFTDPWGSYTAVHHYYRLQGDRNGYYISDFQTTQTNRW